MKRSLSQSLLLASICLGFGGLTSCEVTGDPNSGGIFWSSQKAQQRLDERQNTLDRVQSDTRAVNRDSARKQRKIDQLQ